MNLLDRLLGHDLDTTREMLTLCLNLTDAQMDQDIDAGWRTLRRTFNHMISNVEIWTDLIKAQPVRNNGAQDSVPELLARLDAAYAEFAQFAWQVENEGRLDDLWTDVLDNPPRQKSYGGAIGHVITHDMHHRAEVLHMLHRLGLQDLPEGDLMGWDQRRRSGEV